MDLEQLRQHALDHPLIDDMNVTSKLGVLQLDSRWRVGLSLNR